MSQPAIIRNHTYKPFLTLHKPNFNREQVVETAYTVVTFTLAVLLICLGLRVVLALLVISNPLTEGLTRVTDLFVLPFTRIINDQHDMLQISTATSFTAYYVFYWIIALINKLFRRPKQPSAFQY